MNFSVLSSYFQKLEKTSSRLAMTDQLADLFKKASHEDIGYICYLLQGRVAPLYEAIEFGVADRFVIRALAKAYATDEKDVVSAFKKYGDLGIAGEEIAKKQQGKDISVKKVFENLKTIALLSGQGSQDKKITLLSELFSSLDPLSVRYVARIPLGKLRLGFSDMTILDGLSVMLVGDKSVRGKLEDAYNVRPDLAYIAKRIKEKGVDGISRVGASVGAPILAALCQRLPDALEMIKKMGEVDVEPKYDGVRTQIHFKSQKEKRPWVQSFSRNLENTTAMYPELLTIGKQIDADEIILDSEAVGYDPKTDRLIPFQETVTRKRKHGIAGVSKSVPLRFFVFDILAKDGQDLMSTPFSKRRAILEDTIKKGDVLSVSPNIVTSDVTKLRSYHNQQLEKGLEGVVVKKWESPYEPGRKGYHWVKFKEEDGKTGKLTDTVDCVVMGYYRGEGKRAGFGIGAFLVGVKKGDRFVTLTKIGTGVSDEQWKELKKEFTSHSTAARPKEYEEVNKVLEPDFWIEPSMVVEIAADDITKSPTHGASFALRFPRLVRIRTDKSPGQATTVKEITTMYDNQSGIKQR